MRQWRICLIAGISLTAACSSNEIRLPSCDIPGPSPEIASPLSVPQMPVEASSDDSTATFDLAGLLQLERVRVAGNTNFEVARQNALALRARNAEIEALIECSRYQQVWMEVREEMLEQERRDHFIDNLWHRGLIVLIGVGVTL